MQEKRGMAKTSFWFKREDIARGCGGYLGSVKARVKELRGQSVGEDAVQNLRRRGLLLQEGAVHLRR
jgi:hypothetical protein